MTERVEAEEEEYRAIHPSQAPKLIPDADNNMAPGGALTGLSSFADGATSDYRSRGSKIFIRVVTAVVLVSLVISMVWRFSA